MKTRIGKVTKVVLCILIVIGISLTLPVAKAVPLHTHHSSWHLIRAMNNEDGATFAATYDLSDSEGDFRSKNPQGLHSGVLTGGAFRIPSRKPEAGASEGYSAGTKWMIAICGGDPNDTFSFDLIGWSKLNGMIQVLAEGDGVIGTQDVVEYPHNFATADPNIHWADTISLDETTRWPSINTHNNGHNSTSFILFDTTGIEWLQLVLYDCVGTGIGGGAPGEAYNLSAYGRRY